jgi:adhesin transport system membrane fusion protein
MDSTDFRKLSSELSGREGARNSLLMFSIILLVLLAGAWAHLTELDNVTRGEGRIVSAMQNQTVQAAEGGVILRRNVSEGSVVAEGEILFEIDPIDVVGELDRANQRNAALKVRELRLQAEVAGTAPTFPAELVASAPTVVAVEESLYRARESELQGALAVLTQSRMQREQELADAEVSIMTASNTADLLRREIAIMEPLVAQSIAPETRLLELRRQLEGAEGSRQSAETAASRARAGIEQVNREIQNRSETALLESMRELSGVVAEIGELEKVIPALEERVSRTTIRAPVQGIVNQLNFRTTGGYVNKGDVILELVPTGDDLVIEAQIKPADIANIRLGDEVKIRLSAYDSAKYGTVPGAVTSISPDAIQNRETGESHYVIEVSIDGGISDEKGQPVTFIPGMQATVDVLSGKRTVLEYIWQPMAKVQELALRD